MGMGHARPTRLSSKSRTHLLSLSLTDVRCLSRQANSIDLTFALENDDTEDPITSCDAQQRKDEGRRPSFLKMGEEWETCENVEVIPMNGGRWRLTIGNLQGNTKYSFRVRARNCEGSEGDFCPPLSSSTLAIPAKPAKLHCVSTFPDAIALQWQCEDPRGAPITDCEVFNNGEKAVFAEPPKKNNGVWSAIVCGLESCRLYELWVTSKNTFGQCEDIAVASFQTSDSPSAPYSIHCKFRTEDSVTLTLNVDDPMEAVVCQEVTDIEVQQTMRGGSSKVVEEEKAVESWSSAGGRQGHGMVGNEVANLRSSISLAMSTYSVRSSLSLTKQTSRDTRTWSSSTCSASRMEGTRWQCVISGLQGNTDYEFRLRGANSSGWRTRFSEPFPVSTARIPGQPTKLTCVKKYPDGVRVEWVVADPEGAPILQCSLELGRGSRIFQTCFAPNGEPKRKANGGVWTATLCGLESQRSYRYQLRAENAIGSCHGSVWGTFSVSDLPGPPYDVRCTNRGPTFFDLSFVALDPVGALASESVDFCEVQLKMEADSDSWFEPNYIVVRDEDSSWSVGDRRGSTWKAELTGLKVGTTYSVRVRAANNTGWRSSSSEPIEIQTISVPPPPTSLCCVRRTPTSLAIQWDAVDADDAPVLSGDGTVDGAPAIWADGGQPEKCSENSWMATINELAPQTDYRISVVSRNVAGLSKFSRPEVLRTSDCPRAPTQLRLSRCSPHTLQIVYSAADAEGAPCLESEIQMASNGWFEEWQTPEFRAARIRGKTWMCETWGLEGGRQYVVRIRARNEVGWGEYSKNTVFGTSPVPDQPRDFQVIRQTPSSLQVQWCVTNPEGAPVKECEVNVHGDDVSGAVGSRPVKHGDDKWSAEVNGLEPRKSYMFRVRTKNAVGWSDFGSATCCTTNVPSAPSRIQCMSKGRDHLVLSWVVEDPSEAPVVACEVQQSELHWGAQWCRSDASISKRQDDNSWEAIVKGLVCEKLYAFRVRAQNSIGWGEEFSEVERCSTSGRPQRPHSLICTRRCLKSLELSWCVDNPEEAPVLECEVFVEDKIAQFEEGRAPALLEGSRWTTVVTGLKPATSYEFRLRARNAVNWCEGAAVASFGTSHVPAAPKFLSDAGRGLDWVAFNFTVTDPEGAPVTRCEVQQSFLAWGAQWGTCADADVVRLWDDCASSVDVESCNSSMQRLKESDESDECVKSRGTWKARIQGLESGTSYAFRIRAQNEVGWGASYSEVQILQTSSVSDRPHSLFVTKRKSDALWLQWSVEDPVGAPVAKCEVLVNDERAFFLNGSEPHRLGDGFAADAWGAVLGDLQPQKQYEIRIRALNSVGWSEGSAVDVFRTTDPPLAVREVKCTRSSVMLLEISWITEDVEGAPVEECEVEQAAGWFDEWTAVTGDHGPVRISGNEWSVVLGKLSENAAYDIRIRARNDAGWGPWCGTCTFRTARNDSRSQSSSDQSSAKYQLQNVC